MAFFSSKPSLFNRFTFLSRAEAPRVKAGTIMFLPPRNKVPSKALTDPNLRISPVVILSCPEPKKISLNSQVKIAIVSHTQAYPHSILFFHSKILRLTKDKQMTSFNNTSIKKHMANKGIKFRSGVVAAQCSGYVRLVTASKPYTNNALKLRNGKGIKGIILMWVLKIPTRWG